MNPTTPLLVLKSYLSAAIALALVAVIAPRAKAQSPEEFRRLLVPVSVSGVTGAYGSVWSTELWYRNNGNRPVAIHPLGVSDAVPSIKRTVRLPIPIFPAHDPGGILFVRRDGSESVQFDLRLYNRAEPSATWGTKLPVVWEDEFVTGVNLINVPTGNDFRAALRIYAFPERWPDGQAARVRIYSHNERLLAEAAVVLQRSPRYGAVLSLTDAFPEIRQVDRVRVEVESPDGAAKLWAFISVTSNRTQFVSIVTPE